MGLPAAGCSAGAQGQTRQPKAAVPFVPTTGLGVRRRERKRLDRNAATMPLFVRPNQEWSMDLVSDALSHTRFAYTSTDMWEKVVLGSAGCRTHATAREERNASGLRGGHRSTARRARLALASGQARPMSGNTSVRWQREGDPRLGARRDNSGDRRPQTHDEPEAGERSDHLRRRNRVAPAQYSSAAPTSTAASRARRQASRPRSWRRAVAHASGFSVRELQRS